MSAKASVDLSPGAVSPIHPGDRAAILGTVEQRRAGSAFLQGAPEEEGSAAVHPRA